jgi:hypothetical protein
VLSHQPSFAFPYTNTSVYTLKALERTQDHRKWEIFGVIGLIRKVGISVKIA